MRIIRLPHLKEFSVCLCHNDTPLTGFRCVPVETTAKAERVETKIVSHQEAQTAKAKRVETKIASHQGAQDPPSDDLSAYLDLSQKLLAVCGSPSEKMVGSDVISKLFTSCQKDIHNLFGCMSMSPPSEITRKLLTDVSSSRIPLHYVNENNTPEAAKVSRLYHSLTKVLVQPCIGVYFALKFIPEVAYFGSNGDIPDMK
jgi:hypothetical protein